MIRTFLVASIAILLGACPPPGYATYRMGANTGPVTAAPTGGTGVVEPAPDTRSAGQVATDALAASSYRCTPEAARWSCMAPNGNWAMYATYYPTETPVTISYDSYEFRAFAKPCAHFANAMTDLAVPADFFTVTCDDTTQQFQFRSYFTFAPDTEYLTWAQNHESHRAQAIKLLNSIGAIRH